MLKYLYFLNTTNCMYKCLTSCYLIITGINNPLDMLKTIKKKQSLVKYAPK